MLEIRPGRNVWVFGRTDKDAPSSNAVILNACQLMAHVLPDVLPGFAPFPSPRGPAEGSRYYLGAARPLDISATQVRPARPRGLANWDWIPGEFALAAERPWFATCDFDWRGPTFTVDPWPHRKTNFLGLEINDPLALDWLLLHAAHMGPATRTDSDFTGDVFQSTKDVAQDAAGAAAGIGLGLAALAVIVYFGTHGRK